jgi:hypothetical protein
MATEATQPLLHIGITGSALAQALGPLEFAITADGHFHYGTQAANRAGVVKSSWGNRGWAPRSVESIAAYFTRLGSVGLPEQMGSGPTQYAVTWRGPAPFFTAVRVDPNLYWVGLSGPQYWSAAAIWLVELVLSLTIWGRESHTAPWSWRTPAVRFPSTASVSGRVRSLLYEELEEMRWSDTQADHRHVQLELPETGDFVFRRLKRGRGAGTRLPVGFAGEDDFAVEREIQISPQTLPEVALPQLWGLEPTRFRQVIRAYLPLIGAHSAKLHAFDGTTFASCEVQGTHPFSSGDWRPEEQRTFEALSSALKTLKKRFGYL